MDEIKQYYFSLSSQCKERLLLFIRVLVKSKLLNSIKYTNPYDYKHVQNLKFSSCSYRNNFITNNNDYGLFILLEIIFINSEKIKILNNLLNRDDIIYIENEPEIYHNLNSLFSINHDTNTNNLIKLINTINLWYIFSHKIKNNYLTDTDNIDPFILKLYKKINYLNFKYILDFLNEL